MKKKSLIIVFLVSILVLVGCKATNNASTNNNITDTEANEDGVNTNTEAGDPSEVSENEEDKKEITIEHSLGTTTVPINVDKAVVFDYGVLDILDALEADATLAVPVSNLPAYLNKYNGAYNAGGIKEPDLEAIFDFEPDVIIISSRQSTYYEQLSEIAPTVYVELNAETYMDDFKKNVDYIAEIFNLGDKVDAKIAEIEAKIEVVKGIAATKEEKALILLTNDGSISVYGSGSRFGIIHDTLGVKQADENIVSSTHGQEVNYEYITKVNPDIIFVIDRTQVVGGSNTVTSTLDNELVNGTNAAKNNKIISLDPDIWYLAGGGIASVNEMVAEIEAAIK